MVTFHARIQQVANGPTISVKVIVPDEVAQLSPEQAKTHLDQLVQQIRSVQDFVIYGFEVYGSYECPPSREKFFGYNTQVEVNLPYTLHLPNDMPFELTCRDVGRATVVFRKVWTESAADSNNGEVYADDQLLYYGPAKIQTPHIPQAPELGPWPRLKGTNVEIGKDTHGVFRYTQIQVFFDSVLDGIDGPDSKEARTSAFQNAKKASTEIINYLLDVYRYVTGAEHTERLSTMNISRVYFVDRNLLSQGTSIESGLGSAIINRSGREIQQFKTMLEDGTDPPRHELLLHSSRAALGRGQSVLAVVVAFQALEIFLESKLRDSYAMRGLADADITAKLKECYKTKDRLTLLCREVTGSSVADDSSFWSLWLNECNRRRNGVVHRNETPTNEQALKVIDLCQQCITRLVALPFPA